MKHEALLETVIDSTGVSWMPHPVDDCASLVSHLRSSVVEMMLNSEKVKVVADEDLR